MTKKEKINKIVDWSLFTITVMLTILFVRACDSKVHPWSLSKAEGRYIMEELDRRGVGDCVIEPTIYGWKCTGHDGKVYRIARN